MSSKKQELMSKIRWIIDKGAVHILGTNVVNKVLSFFTNIFIVRFLTKSEYGIFGYANNIISFFLLVSGLGMLSGVLQYGSENRSEEEKKLYFKYGMNFGLIINGILALLVFLYVKWVPVAIGGTQKYILLMCLVPLLDYVFNYLCTILRCRKENKKYALMLNINTVTYFVSSCAGAFLFGISGVIIGRYIAYMISIVQGVIFCNYKEIISYKSEQLNVKQKVGIIKYSIICCMSNALSQILYLLDVYLIGVYIQDSQVIASYKAATLIPSALTFIPLGIITFIYPYFAENNLNYNWLKEKMIVLFKVLAAVNGAISLGLIILAPWIIKLLWGAEYMDSLASFRILAFNYFLSGTFRIPAGNILAMLKNVKVNLIVSVLAGTANIFLDIFLIQRMGSEGAALATVLVVMISVVISMPALLYKVKSLKRRTNIMKYALIGCGRISTNHVKAVINNKLEFVAVCDVVPEHMEEVLAKHDLQNDTSIKRYTDYKKLVEENELDLVGIATESGLHAEIALYCIEHNINVIIEKPMAMSIEDADKIIKLSEEKGVKVSACHQNRFNIAVQEMRKALEAGRFGKLSHGSIHVRWNRNENYYTQAPWRGTWAQDGGALMNQCIHGIDLLRWMLGNEIDEVYGVTKQQFHDYLEAEDIGMAVVKFKNGAVATIEGTTNVYPQNLEETLYLFGETGTVKLGGKSTNNIDVWNFADETEEDQANKGLEEATSNVYGNGHTSLYADVIDAIENDRAPYVDAYAGRNALELVLAIYKSQKEGKAVKLPLDKFASVDMTGEF